MSESQTHRKQRPARLPRVCLSSPLISWWGWQSKRELAEELEGLSRVQGHDVDHCTTLALPGFDSWGRVRTTKRLPPALYHRIKEYFPMTGRTRSFHVHCVRIPNHAHRGCISFECHCNQNAKMWPGRAHDLCKMIVMVSTRVKEQDSLPSQPPLWT